jgi:1-acyl-sn-glycerol-3-phosphate acyltransferase
MSDSATPGTVAPAPPIEDLVLDTVRGLAREVGGDRAATAAGLDASLERELGLGSLERAELVARLERRFARSLGETSLQLDSARALAEALRQADAGAETPAAPAGPSMPAAVSLEIPGTTLHEVLWRRAESHPERPQCFMREDDGHEHTVSYGALLADASAVAGALRERGIAPGDTVALMLPTGADFLRSFLGILMSRAVPVPIYPPVRLDRLEEYAARQTAILANAGVTALITVPRALPIASLLKPSLPALAQVVTAGELVASGAAWPAPDGDPGDAAFIQYTSGSTGAPKGVLLTHANLLANIRAIAAGLDVRPTDVGASWLPLYHDMGLIGSWLFCLCQGLPIAIQSPLAFLSRPERWLWSVHQRRASLAAAPNFAFELCVRRIPDEALEGLDLSSWRCLLNGAEPINPESLERFARRFEPYGFRREALMPVYGLAECSVALAFPPPGRGPRVDAVQRGPFAEARRAEPAGDDPGALRFVSVGSALPEHELRIVDDEGRDLPERRVGRLVFRGPSMTSGYYRQPAATAAIRLEGGWLDSGDLAYLAEGELYVTGRLKDLIIKGGRNLVPQEIEEVAAQVPGVRRGCVAAFGSDSEEHGTERLVVVAETRLAGAGRARLADEIRERVSSAVGVPPDVVELVRPGSVPKTSSGKIRRTDAKRLWSQGRLGQAGGTSGVQWLRLALGALQARLRRGLALAGRGLWATWLLVVCFALAVIARLALAVTPGRHGAARVERMALRAALWLGGCRLDVSGLERLPRLGPLLLTSNHTSYADIPALLAALPLDFVFLAKHEVRRWPVVGAFVARVGHLTVDRLDARRSLADAETMATAVSAGQAVAVFPEATFTATAGLRPFRLGAFKVAVETGTPVVPVAIRGARRVLRGDAWLPRPGRIRVWVGQPLAPDGADWAAALRLRDRAAAAIAAECGEPRLDLVAGGYLAGSPDG